MNELVHYRTNNGVATITLDSPGNRNALSQRLLTELGAAVERAIDAASVRVAVIEATGPAFCAGADLKERSQPGVSASGLGGQAAVPDVMQRIMECDLPFVARVQGPVRAGGTGIVAACDLAVAASSVTFAVPEVHLGLVPAVISVPISRILDRRSLRRYFLTGEPFDAAEAARIGLITIATDDLDATMADLLEWFRKGHAGALRRTKRLLDETPAMPVAGGFELASAVSAEWFASPDGQEGIRAVLEKRAPSWR